MGASGGLPRASVPATSTILTAAMDERIGLKLSSSKLDMMRSLQPSQTRQQSKAHELLKFRAEQSRAEQSRAEQSRTEQNRAEQSRTEQNRAEQSITEQNRAEQNSDGIIITISVRKTYFALPIDPCKDVYSMFPSLLLSTLSCSSSDETHRLTPRIASPHPQPGRPLLQANLESNLVSLRTKVLKPQSLPVAQKNEAVSCERRRDLEAITLRRRPSTSQALKFKTPTLEARWGMNEDTTSAQPQGNIILAYREAQNENAIWSRRQQQGINWTPRQSQDSGKASLN